MIDLSRIVKAYDVRGTVPDQLNEPVAEALGRAFVQTLRHRGEFVERVVTAHDMRESGPALASAFAAGVRAEGADVVESGLGSTDLLYFASGTLDLPGAMFTASHNPAQYNGVKLCKQGAKPVGQDSGLAEIRERAQAILEGRGEPATATRQGTIEQHGMLEAYAAYLRGLVDLTGIRPLTVVVDAGNGMGGYTVPAVLGQGLPLTIIPLYFELDGSFPNHEANPLEPANLVDLQAKVRETGADLGLAFDGDADRCFVIDERGEAVSPSTITSMVAVRELAKSPGATIIHNLITSRAVPEIVREHGGVPVRTRVGHSFIKAEMARTGAVFGGEHSAHYYFSDFWGADTGMLAAMHTLAMLGGQAAPLSALTKDYVRYTDSGEINSTVADPAAKMAEIEAAYPVPVDRLDGITLDFPDGSWVSVRPSNTEPLLRLNVEAPTAERMAALRDEMLDVIRR
ncbi:phosphomannomutase/phosphoglucomutase [Dactylosporangium sp. NBC_01737]|uniref:phosphomannomutase/phosphoglucomutase n=1 Tax=Dactylosporangium sp. NBC_01737 TaxID=2975959 RepID=UPI002E100DC2|nr:phosphomannomutase/phosphoglucomutase [Dactylosporangium sp. NBC_01737]